MSSWLVPSIIATMTGSFLLGLVYFYLARAHKDRSMLLWAGGWLCYGLRFGFMLTLILHDPQSRALLLGNQLLAHGSTFFLLWGTYAFRERTLPRLWLAPFLGTTIWIVLATLYQAPFFWLTFPTFIFLGLVQIWIGILFIRVDPGGFATKAAGWLFIAWGLHKMNYPVLRPLEWFAPFGYLIGALLSLAISVVVILVYYERAQIQIQRTADRFRLLAENARDFIFRFTLEPDFGFEFVSPSCETMTGYAPNRFLADPSLLLKLVHPADTRRFDTLDKLLTASADCPLVIRWVHADGSIIWTEQHLVVARDDEGRPVAMEGIVRDITRRRETLKELRKAKEHAFNILDSTTDAFFEVDRDFRVTSMNRKAEKPLFHSREELLGNILWEVFPQAVETRFYSEYHRAMREQVPVEFDEYYPPFQTWYEVHAFPTPESLSVYFRDITDRKMEQQTLAFRSSLLEAQMEAAADAILVVSPEGSCITANTLFQRLSGLDPRRIVSSPWRSAMEPLAAQADDPEAFLRRLEEIHDSTRAGVLERIPLRDGRILEGYSARVLGADGEMLGRFWSYRDITERTQWERALVRSEKRYRAAFDDAAIGMAEVSLFGNLERCNKSFAAMLGYRPEELTGRGMRELAHPEEQTEGQIFERLLSGPNNSVTAEKRYLHRDGHVVWMIFHTTRITDDNGETRYFIVQFEDITQRKHAEQALIEAKEMAESANKAKTQFLANMSHELRTPLNAIQGLTELLFLSSPSPEQKEYLQLVRQSGQDLLAIVNNLLDLSSIDDGSLILREEPFNLREILEDVLRVVRLQAGWKRLELEASIEDAIPDDLKGDVRRLRQALTNILVNAVKYTDHGQVRLHVSEKESSPGASHLEFVISDTGPGIPPDKLEHIFEPFVLGEDFLTKRHGGAGLGLAIARTIIQRLGGSIQAESEPGQGSTFTFNVRLDRPSTRPETAKTLPSREIDPAARSLNILVAEDDMINQKMILEFLRKKGHETLCVPNGTGVLEALRNRTFDLILMDVQMPEMDGLEATRAIRSAVAPSFDKTIPIIAMTAHARENDRELFLSEGMTDYIAKPLDLDRLEAIILRNAGR